MKRVEHNLLTQIARRDLTATHIDAIRDLLHTDIDWAYLTSTAREHGLLPLLYRHLSTVATDVPPDQFENIKREAVANSQGVLYLLNQLDVLVRYFQDAGLPVLVFKGPILAELAYGEISLRQAGDLDLLISGQDFGRAKTLLESLGYQMTPQLTTRQQTAHLSFHCEIQFVRDNGFSVVDLHWSLSPKVFPFRVSTYDLMKRARQVVVAGQSFNTFGLEDLIVFQCMHSAKHYWSRVEWISSLAEVIRYETVDWATLIERARLARVSKIVALGLRLAERLGEVPIPATTFEALDPNGTMKEIAAKTLSTIFEPANKKYLSVKAVGKNLKIMDRKWDALAAMIRATFVPTLSDWKAVSLPERLQPLYYVLRPFRLSKSYAVSVWQNLAVR